MTTYIILPHDVVPLRASCAAACTTLGVHLALDLVLAGFGLGCQAGSPLHKPTWGRAWLMLVTQRHLEPRFVMKLLFKVGNGFLYGREAEDLGLALGDSAGRRHAKPCALLWFEREAERLLSTMLRNKCAENASVPLWLTPSDLLEPCRSSVNLVRALALITTSLNA